MQRALALVVVAMLVLSSGARATIPSVDLGRLVSVVVSKLDPRDATPERTVTSLGGKVGAPLRIVDGFEAKVPEGALGRLAMSPGVRGMERNTKVRFHGQYGENSGVASAVYTDNTRASKVWNSGNTGQGINVAVIDTGVDVTGDLAGRVIHAEDFSGENAPLQDNFGHGTFVAGLIAGTGAASGGKVSGMAPGAGIVSVKIAGRDGSTNMYRLLAALEWVATNKDAYGIRVLNLSLGSDSQQSYLVDPLDFAVERLWNSGIVVVTASGNHGNAKGTIVKPGDDPLVITVGALDDKTSTTRDDDGIASFSGSGPTSQDGLAKPDVVASGKSVVSVRSPGSFIDQAYSSAQVGTGYFKGSGTSFSAAIVSGAAALVIAKTWSLNPNQVKQRLIGNARPMDDTPRYQQGYGAIDAYGATNTGNTDSANRNVKPAVGMGSLNASSGSACFKNADGTCMTDADANAMV
ncbi:MAG TPA: S8 family peptidase, partial [Acidimicrobiales bacterium]|nr:S8 family peptidase [Acidimicrobiales bacterium]